MARPPDFRKFDVSIYLIGDIQGCRPVFQRLLQQIEFSPSRDCLYLLGDLVNRGPDSAGVLRDCMRLGDAVRPLLGNHDLHLLAMAHGIRQPSRKDTLQDVLQAPDSQVLLDWVAQQPLARSLTSASGQRLLMVHAGVQPSWDLDTCLRLAGEVQEQLRGPQLPSFLSQMYGNQPDHWQDDWRGADRLRVIVNTLTRIRFCSADGVMDFDSTEAAEAAPPGLMPWFDCPERQTRHDLIAFGHWSTLGLIDRPELLALDTGCVWGGCLTAMELGADFALRQLHQVGCEQAQRPGKL